MTKFTKNKKKLKKKKKILSRLNFCLTTERQIKTTMKGHLTLVKRPSSKNLQIINAREGMEKRKPSHTAGGNRDWYSHYGEQYGLFVV